MNVVAYFIRFHMDSFKTDELEFLLYTFTLEDYRLWGNPNRYKKLMSELGFSPAWEQAFTIIIDGSLTGPYEASRHPTGNQAKAVDLYKQINWMYNRYDF